MPAPRRPRLERLLLASLLTGCGEEPPPQLAPSAALERLRARDRVETWDPSVVVPEIVVRGRVLDPEERPAPGERVRSGEREVWTDAEGRYALIAPAGAEVRVKSIPWGAGWTYRDWKFEVPITAEGSYEAPDLRAVPQCRYRLSITPAPRPHHAGPFRVVDRSHTPAEVLGTSANEPVVDVISACMGQHVEVRADRASAALELPAAQPCTEPECAPTELAVTLEPLPAVEIDVEAKLSDGSPAADMLISATHLGIGDFAMYGDTTTDAQGRARLTVDTSQGLILTAFPQAHQPVNAPIRGFAAWLLRFVSPMPWHILTMGRWVDKERLTWEIQLRPRTWVEVRCPGIDGGCAALKPESWLHAGREVPSLECEPLDALAHACAGPADVDFTVGGGGLIVNVVPGQDVVVLDLTEARGSLVLEGEILAEPTCKVRMNRPWPGWLMGRRTPLSAWAGVREQPCGANPTTIEHVLPGAWDIEVSVDDRNVFTTSLTVEDEPVRVTGLPGATGSKHE